jgi:hypothetical protein
MALGMGIGRVLNKFTFTADQVYTEVKAVGFTEKYEL